MSNLAERSSSKADRLDMARWRDVPNRMIGVGGVLAVVGLIVCLLKGNAAQFGYSWLVAFMFCLSLCLGGLFLVLVHHLFDASWSVPIRRICEHIACLLFPWMALFFVPIALLAPKLYAWMTSDPQTDHALHAKMPLFTLSGFYLTAIICFVIWWVLAHGLRRWSIKQDESGAAECTHRMRRYAYWGIFAFAITLTLAAVMWMKALQHQWFSTMYGVYYFAGSVWTTLATVYVITMILSRTGVLREVLHQHQFYYIGSLFFAFTVFYAYIHFSQYFIIWNANMPEETFWYKLREQGSWMWVSMFIIFGHFFLPFLALLRIDAKESFPLMTFFAAWAWFMHYLDMSFNVMPVPHPKGFAIQWAWLDLACIALIAGVLIKVFLAKFAGAKPFPVKDPRLMEAVGLYHAASAATSGGLEDGGFGDRKPQSSGGK